jgi:hypothetical protein
MVTRIGTGTLYKKLDNTKGNSKINFPELIKDR